MNFSCRLRPLWWWCVDMSAWWIEDVPLRRGISLAVPVSRCSLSTCTSSTGWDSLVLRRRASGVSSPSLRHFASSWGGWPCSWLSGRSMLSYGSQLWRSDGPLPCLVRSSPALADCLSLAVWTLSTVFLLRLRPSEALWALWVVPLLVLLAFALAPSLRESFSAVPVPLASGVDVWLRPWEGLLLLASLRFAPLRRVLQ